VPFSFAPVLGIDRGSTGSQIAVACAGSCGEVAPNPMDVMVVADRTGSMGDDLPDLVDGIKSMLQVMTPELQYVSLGTIGPSYRSRSGSNNAESKACSSNSTSGRGLTWPGGSADPTAGGGSWVPITFKNDYLGGIVNGARSLNSSSNLVKALNCIDHSSTGTTLASPLKAAARFLLNKPGDANNIASLPGRSGEIRKVIIFETDGEPNESPATTSGTISLDNATEIFSKSDNYTVTGPVTTTNNTTESGRPSGVDRPDQCPRSSSSAYACTYETIERTTTTTTTHTYNGGQQACRNLKQVANLVKQEDVLVITIGYGIDGTRCNASNPYSNGSTSSNTNTGNAYISDVDPLACKQSGQGTPQSPYTLKSDCKKKVTWTVSKTVTTTVRTQDLDNPLVTDVLADASGGTDYPAGSSNGCSNSTLVDAENADSDLFFCAARGDDLAPLFVTALGSVTDAVKLIRLP
jgi:hypothetical protein